MMAARWCGGGGGHGGDEMMMVVADDMVVLGGDEAGWWWWRSDGDDDGGSSGEGSWGDGGVRWEAGDGWPEVGRIRLGGAGKIREKKEAMVNKK
ncbi:hypothetical protein Tco_0388679, partial [Tanacetum coccineum]